jgi:hypothetical protein
MAKNILQEAIADAKRVKSAALANAKIALEETFQPTLQRMISSKLAEEDELENEDGMFESDIEIEVNPEDEMGGDDMGGEAPPTGFGGSQEPAEEEPEQDMELEALIRELEGEEDDEFAMEGEEDDFQSTNPGAPEAGEDFETFSEADGDGAYEEDVVESVLEALLGEEEGLGDELDMGPNKEDGSTYDDSVPNGPQFLENRKLRNENKKLKKDLQEAFRTITTYKQAINEVNLLNAKLMFTTKTLRQFELNENQQVRILESFDRAKSVREVKLVYTTIVESFNKNKKGKPAIKENKGLASKTVKQHNPKAPIKNNQSRSIINEGTITRLQELAGLRKLKD